MVDTSNNIEIKGLIVSERHVANGKREICIQKDSVNGSVATVLLDSKAYTSTSKWFTVKKARNLIYPGVGLFIIGKMQEEEEDGVIHSISIDIVSVNPRKQYLARLFSFSLDDLYKLFPNSQERSLDRLPSGFIEACTPISEQRLQTVFQFCQKERNIGRGDKLWNTPEIEELSVELFQSQSDNTIIQPKPKSSYPPRVSKQSLEAVGRMERWYLRSCDGIVDDYVFHPETHTYTTRKRLETEEENLNKSTFHYGHIDPCHNLPDPNDARRLLYIDERKRPQVKAMLEFIQQLIKDQQKRMGDDQRCIRLVDIGGGRGYLGIAVAGSLAKVHVTVIDNNVSSLQAGKSLAKTAGLSNMDFVNCDLSESLQVEKLVQREFDIVFGLHCCGGLAEAAVELAIKSRADFCVSTCCFRSNPELSSLTRLAETMMRTNVVLQSTEEDIDEMVCRYKKDVSRVATLAVTVGGKDQHSAIRAYNSMRLVAAEKYFETTTFQSEYVLRTWQEAFPVEYSVQNRVLMGTIVER